MIDAKPVSMWLYVWIYKTQTHNKTAIFPWSVHIISTHWYESFYRENRSALDFVTLQ